jgi:hypothetical protein
VFVASPGGLEQERGRFREIINEYNETDALQGGVLFAPVGWELTIRGMGRPQKLINDDIKSCDYCLLVLHDRWGSPPSPDTPYTSGTEEEYALARTLVIAGTMLDLVVLFKSVDASRLADPGPQLQKVLDFKRRLEVEKELFYGGYDDVSGFERIFRRQLSAWMRAHAQRLASDGGDTG